MADMHIKQGGSWTSIANCKVKVGGAWTQVSKIYAKVAGTWQTVWTNYVVTLSGATISASAAGSPIRCTLILKSDGTTQKREDAPPAQINASTDWVIPNSAASGDFDAKWTVSGDAPSEVTAGWNSNTYLPLSSDLTVGYATNAPGVETGTFTITIRDPDSNETSNTYTITAEEL